MTLHFLKKIITLAGARAVIKVSSHQHWLLAGGYDLDVDIFTGG